VDAVDSIRPTTIIVVSTIGGAQEVIEAMSRINGRRLMLAIRTQTKKGCLSRRTLCSNGKAICAADVQLTPVPYKGQTFAGPSQQLLHFPVGMTIFATQASWVTGEMLIEAGRCRGGSRKISLSLTSVRRTVRLRSPHTIPHSQYLRETGQR
jgi:Malic enzyme, NAD binding domain